MGEATAPRELSATSLTCPPSGQEVLTGPDLHLVPRHAHQGRGTTVPGGLATPPPFIKIRGHRAPMPSQPHLPDSYKQAACPAPKLYLCTSPDQLVFGALISHAFPICPW